VGENPLIYDELPKIVDYCVDRGLKVGINTNGLFLDTANKEMLSKLESITISVLSDDKTVYDYLRPDGSYKRVWDNVKSLVDGPIPKKTVLTIINSVTYNDLVLFTRRMKKLGYNVAFNVQDHYFSDHDGSKSRDLDSLFDLDTKRLQSELKQLADAYPDTMSYEWAEHIVDYFKRYPKRHSIGLDVPICDLKIIRIEGSSYNSDTYRYSCITLGVHGNTIEELERNMSFCRKYCGVQGGQCRYNPGFVREPLSKG